MNRIFIRACLCAGFFSLAGILSAGPAFDELVEAAGGEDMSVIFDGAEKGMDEENVGFRSGVEDALVLPAPQEPLIYAATAHLPGPIRGKILGETGLSDDVERVVARAKQTLAATAIGKSLAKFMERENVRVKSAPLGAIDRGQAYAKVCAPEDCHGKKIIYLSNSPEHRNLFLDPNPTFLTVVLAHELTHLVDFKDMDGGVTGNQRVAGFFLELNGWSNETYVYHELLVKGVAPKPASESKALQEVRLNLAIRDYVNGGKRPVLKDFPLLVTIGEKPFDEYVKKVTEKPRKGSMSLAGVVKLRYDLDSAEVEEMAKPPYYDHAATREYEKYLKLRNALGYRTAAYIDWKKANVDAPSYSLPGLPDDNYGGGGQYNPGGGDYNLPPLPSPNVDFDGGGFSPFSF